jgi:lipoate---protein ligase
MAQSWPSWRLIPPLQVTGSMHMAIDHWLLEQHRQGLIPPSLRFYTWEPAAISLGYHQRQWPDHWQHLEWQGQTLDLVRRPSGGRAVLHQGDLTYAVILSGLNGSRLAGYQYICEFLCLGWQHLGQDLNYGHVRRAMGHNPNCFSLATGADLVLSNGYKLIGSAQLCRQQAILQHGSIRLRPDPDLTRQVFGADALGDDPPKDLPDPSTVITALTQAAQQWFGVELEPQPLSEAEWQAIKALQAQNQQGGAAVATPPR